jgi:sugar lactone lactonase YvrE
MIRLVLIFCFCTVYLQAHPPWGIVLDSHRNIYFADIFHEGRGAVWKLDADGHLERLLGDFHVHNVCLDRDQYVVAAHGEGSHTLVRYRSHEQLDTLFQSEHHADFNGGNCTYSKQGNIYFQADHFVWMIDSSGQKRKYHPHRLEWAQTIYVDENENVYVPDIGIGRGHLYRLPPDGTC